MKKILSIFALVTFTVFLTSCFGDKKTDPAANQADKKEVKSEEVNADAEQAVKEYEDWLVKYDDLTARSEKGEDVFDELMALQETVFDISEKLISTERLRNDDQKARVKAVEEKAEQIKRERVMK